MENNLLFNILSQDAFISVNKKMIVEVGAIPAIILGELIYEYKYWESKKQCNQGWFFSTVDNIESQTGIKEKQQASAINKLIEEGIVEKRLFGIPCKRYFRINSVRLLEILSGENEELRAKPEIDEEISKTIATFKNAFYRKYKKAYKECKNDYLNLAGLDGFDLKLYEKIFENLDRYIEYDGTIKESNSITISFLLVPFRKQRIINFFNEHLCEDGNFIT